MIGNYMLIVEPEKTTWQDVFDCMNVGGIAVVINRTSNNIVYDFVGGCGFVDIIPTPPGAYSVSTMAGDRLKADTPDGVLEWEDT